VVLVCLHGRELSSLVNVPALTHKLCAMNARMPQQLEALSAAVHDAADALESTYEPVTAACGDQPLPQVSDFCITFLC
jgi:hypothetical protein